MSKFSIEALFKARNQVTNIVGKIGTDVSRMTRSVTANIGAANRMVDGQFRAMRKLSLGFAAAGAAAGFPLKNIIDTGAEFERTLTNAAVRFPGMVRRGTEAYEELGRVAKQVGADTEFTATQAAEGLSFLAMAGMDAQQSIAALPKLVDLATASGVDLGRASDIATDALGAMGLASADAGTNAANLQRIMDVMTRATSDSNQTIDHLFEAIQKGGSTATTAGVSIEEFSASMAVLANAGIKGGEAGTAFRNAILELSAPNTAAIKSLKQLGIQVARTEDGSLDFTKTIGNLTRATENLTKEQQIQALSNIFGRRTLGPMLTQMREGEDVLGGFKTALEAATGSTKDIASEIRGDARGAFQSLGSVIESVKLDAFDIMRDDVLALANASREWLKENRGLIKSKLTDWLTKIRDNLPDIIKWTERLATGAAVWLGFAATVKTVGLVFAGYETIVKGVALTKAAYAAITSSATLGTLASGAAAKVAGLGFVGLLKVLLPVAAAIGAVALAWDQWNKLTKEVGGWEGIKSGASSLMEGRGFFAGVDEHMNREAKKRAKAQERRTAIDAVGIGTAGTSLESIMSGDFLKGFSAQIPELERSLGGAASAGSEGMIKGVVGGMPDIQAALNTLNMPTIRIEGTPAVSPQMISPQERSNRDLVERMESRQITENRLLIEDSTGRAKLEGPKNRGINLQPGQPSGAF